jgi:hypothetical protein
MPLKAAEFIQNRGKVIRFTYERVNQIVWYCIECYNLLLKEKPSYSKSYVAAKTAFNFEDYLKIQFVENYLKLNKDILRKKVSELEEITFYYETVKPFIDTTDNNKERSDKIDIYVNKLGLKNHWAVEDEDLYLSIECKRIGILSDCENYIKDTENFCTRQHKYLRLPFEGQIGFIENNKLNHSLVSVEINRRIKLNKTITTKKPLVSYLIHSGFNGIYLSEHKRNYKAKEKFTIFHLLFDYSSLVVN